MTSSYGETAPRTPRDLRSNYEPGTSRWATRRAGLTGQVAVVTDGQLSGLVNKGIVVGEVSPEAYVWRDGEVGGGPLGLVRDGDTISIDVPARTANLEVSREELAARKAGLAADPPPRPVEVGWLSVYQRLARPLPEGAVLRPRGSAS